MSQPIILYDIAMAGESPAEKAWSPNSWKTRILLNVKGLAHKTEWMTFSQTAETLSALGLAAHKTSDPRKFTVPAILDPSTGRAVMGSQDIAKYLEEQYPNSPAVLPAGTRALQAAFYNEISEALIVPVFTSLVYKHLEKTQDVDRDYFYKSREAIFGIKFDDIAPKGEQVQAALDAITSILGRAAGYITEGGGRFVGESRPVNADVNLVAMLIWATTVGEGTAVAKTILEADGGRWTEYIKSFEKWRVFH
ncbi:hypothetical protein PENSPDRAFT_747366 [Peniophora sp. CONT]|nr:hypothetical protein PENSPDRAFT_747366 [Peniophora sp. CONT]